MARDKITDTNGDGHFGYGELLNPTTVDALITQHNEHADALDALGATGNVTHNNLTLNGTLGVSGLSSLFGVLNSGNIRFTSSVSKALNAGSQNNVDFGSGMANASTLNLNGNAANSTVTGILPRVGTGETYMVWNKGTGTVTLTHNDANSTAANRFLLAGATNRVIAVNEGFIMQHNGVNWYII